MPRHMSINNLLVAVLPGFLVDTVAVDLLLDRAGLSPSAAEFLRFLEELMQC